MQRSCLDSSAPLPSLAVPSGNSFAPPAVSPLVVSPRRDACWTLRGSFLWRPVAQRRGYAVNSGDEPLPVRQRRNWSRGGCAGCRTVELSALLGTGTAG